MSSKTNKITGDYEFIISRYVWSNILFFKIIKIKFKNIISVSAQVNFLLIFFNFYGRNSIVHINGVGENMGNKYEDRKLLLPIDSIDPISSSANY